MSQFTLPSGRVVETHEPTFGEELRVVSAGAVSIEEMIYAKFAVIVPGLTREEIGALDRKDGRALTLEIGRIWDGRPDDQEAPFGLPSSGGSAASRSLNRKRRRALNNSGSAAI